MGWREGQAIYWHRKILLELHMNFLLFKQMGIGVTDLRVLQKCLPQDLDLQWDVGAVRPALSSSAQSCRKEPTQNCSEGLLETLVRDKPVHVT